MPTNVTNEPEVNVITKNQMARIREIDFTRRFAGTILRNLMAALGVTRKIPLIEGTTLYTYKTVGTLQNGNVPEGELIPLSQFERVKEPVGEITLKKWRKAVTAEAIMKSGYNEAVRETDAELLKQVQAGVRKDFFDFLKDIDGTAIGAPTLQMVLARTWGNLQVLFENDAIAPVHFVHPLTIADYLGSANIVMQQAFGLNYIRDFLGLGTVILSSQIPVGQVFSTAQDNLIMYYVPIDADAMAALGLTVDDTGYIGINSGYPTHNRAQVESLVMSGITFLVEYADGVVMGQIDSTPDLGTFTVTSTDSGATAAGDSMISVSGYTLASGEKYVYKTAKDTAPAVKYGQKLGSGWAELTTAAGTNITPATGHNKITVAVADANGRAQMSASTDLTLKS